MSKKTRTRKTWFETELEHNYDSKELRDAVKILAQENILDWDKMFAKSYRSRTQIETKALNYLKKHLNSRYFDHIFSMKNGKQIIIETHPYHRLNGQDLEELGKFDKEHGVIVNILPASYWNLGSTTGIRFTLNMDITPQIRKENPY